MALRKLSLGAFVKARDGGTAVEFAMVAVPFLLVLLGIFEFGRIVWTREALQMVAGEAARCMGVLNSACAVSGAYSAGQTLSHVEKEAQRLAVSLSSKSITLNANTTCSGQAGFSSVSITYTYKTAVPLFIKSLSKGIPITVTSCFPNQA